MTDQKMTDVEKTSEAGKDKPRLLALFVGIFIAFVVIALLYSKFFPEVTDDYSRQKAFTKCQEQFDVLETCISRFREHGIRQPSLLKPSPAESSIPPQCRTVDDELGQCLERAGCRPGREHLECR
jgi:hypothetical protein